MTPGGPSPLPYDEAGAGPPLILLHAGIADRRMWAGHLGPLAADGRRVVAVDLPGFGDAPPRPELSPWRDVLATMDALAIDRAALLGNSFGGAVALSTAVTAPERVTALVLVSTPPPGLEPSPELTAVWDAEEAAIERGDLDQATRAMLDAWLLPDATPALRELVAAMVRRGFDLQTAADEPVEVEDPAEASPDALERLDIPALVTAGEHDMVDFRAGAEMMASRLPRARHAIIPGSRHLAPLEQPDAFRELLRSFLGP